MHPACRPGGVHGCCYTGMVRLPASTIEGFETREQRRAALWGRRVVVSLIALLVLAGATGWLGVRTTTEVARQGGYTLALEHASTARSGLDVPWRVTVDRSGGFGKTLTLAVTGDYFDIYETQGFSPEPSAETRDGSRLYLTFDTPPGETFMVSYDAYIQPSSQLGRSGTLSVVDPDGQPLVSLDFSTHLLP